MDYLYPTLDAATRTLKVRLRFANPDEFLKPNMFAKVSIRTGQGEPRLVVPSEAVIRTGSQDRLVLALGMAASSRWLSPWAPVWRQGCHQGRGRSGDSIVSSAQFLLDSESAIDSDFQRMTAVRPAQVWTQGEVESIDLANRTLMVSHQPIPEWQWPAMEMEFTVADGVDMSKLTEGQTLHLQVMQEGMSTASPASIRSKRRQTAMPPSPQRMRWARWKAWTIASTIWGQVMIPSIICCLTGNRSSLSVPNEQGAQS